MCKYSAKNRCLGRVFQQWSNDAQQSEAKAVQTSQKNPYSYLGLKSISRFCFWLWNRFNNFDD